MPHPSNPLYLWNKVRTTNPEITKKVTFGRGFTAIDPQYQVAQATALWGEMGILWGLRNLRFTRFEVEAMDRSNKQNPVPFQQTQMMLEAEFFFPVDGVIEQAVDMPFKAGDDCTKKLITGCRSKAMSGLGFGADVFMGMHDDSEYTKQLRSKYAKDDDWKVKAIAGVRKCSTKKGLAAATEKVTTMLGKGTIENLDAMEIIAVIAEQQEELDKGGSSE